jgi:hypothetical protein
MATNSHQCPITFLTLSPTTMPPKFSLSQNGHLTIAQMPGMHLLQGLPPLSPRSAMLFPRYVQRCSFTSLRSSVFFMALGNTTCFAYPFELGFLKLFLLQDKSFLQVKKFVYLGHGFISSIWKRVWNI